MHKGQPTFAAFLFLFLLTSASTCSLSSVDECKRAITVPGHSIIGSGFDITTMERTVNSILDMNYKYPNGTCHLCINTIMPKNPLQAIAWNIDSWATIIFFKDDIRYSHHSSVISVAEMEETAFTIERSGEVKIPIPKIQGSVGFIFTGSHSELVRNIRRQSMASNNVYFHHEVFCKHYSMKLQRNPVISSRFQNWTNTLPADYNCHTKKEYFKFIRHYGTHFINAAVLGGRAKTVTRVEQCSMTVSQLTTKEISDCLAVGVAVTAGGGLESSESIKGCKTTQEQTSFATRSKLLDKQTSHMIYGGNLALGQQALNGKVDIGKWIDSTQNNPEVFSQEITPIHELLPQNSPQRDNLQKAVRDYITQRALKVDCVNRCPEQQGSSDPRKDCHCACGTSGFLNNICCPRQKHSGKMTVWIDRGKNLYGDVFGLTDAFVKVAYHNTQHETDVVWNNNNPEFNKEIDMGKVLLISNTIKLEITVLDKDHWSTEELGSCSIDVRAGPIQHKTCILNDGYLEFRYKVQCENALHGPSCEQLIPQSPTFSSFLSE